MKLYSKEHQWVEQDGQEAVVGISAFAAESLGELNYVELPKVGASFKAGDVLCAVESLKAASEVFMPVGGTVVAVNTELADNPAMASDDPEGSGWICRITFDDAAEFQSLMDAKAYEAMEK